MRLADVQAAQWELAFGHKRDWVKKWEAQKQRCADCSVQAILGK